MKSKRALRVSRCSGMALASGLALATACSSETGPSTGVDSRDEPSESSQPDESSESSGCPGPDGKPLPSGDILYRIPGDIADVDRVGDTLYYVGLASVVGGPGKGGVFRAPADGSGTPEQVIATSSILNLTVLGGSLYADTAFNGVFQYSLDGERLADWSSVGDDSMTDGESLYAWYNDFSSCDSSEDFGLNRLDTDGMVTSIDDDAHCIKGVAVGGDYVYWLQGDTYADITGSGTPISLYRAPRAGGGPRESFPLDVSGWSSLEWTEGHVIGAFLSGFQRGRPEDAKPVQVGHDVSDLTNDGAGTVFFSDQSESYSCLVHAQGGGNVVRYGSYDSDISLVHHIAAYPDYTYYTADAVANSDGLDRVTLIRRVAVR